jgi:hypothetical protein
VTLSSNRPSFIVPPVVVDRVDAWTRAKASMQDSPR